MGEGLTHDNFCRVIKTEFLKGFCVHICYFLEDSSFLLGAIDTDAQELLNKGFVEFTFRNV